MASALRAADIVLLTSTWEAPALVAQEALLAGVPLVSTRVGGIAELVGQAAVLVEPGDVAGRPPPSAVSPTTRPSAPAWPTPACNKPPPGPTRTTWSPTCSLLTRSLSSRVLSVRLGSRFNQSRPNERHEVPVLTFRTKSAETAPQGRIGSVSNQSRRNVPLPTGCRAAFDCSLRSLRIAPRRLRRRDGTEKRVQSLLLSPARAIRMFGWRHP